MANKTELGNGKESDDKAMANNDALIKQLQADRDALKAAIEAAKKK